MDFDSVNIQEKFSIIIENEVDRLFKLSCTPTGLDEKDLKKLEILAKIKQYEYAAKKKPSKFNEKDINQLIEKAKEDNG